MDKKRSRELFKLIQSGDIKELKSFITGQYQDDSWKYEKHVKSGDGLLHITVRRGNYSLLKWLVSDNSLKLSVTNNDGKQPVHDAAQFSRMDCLRYLIDNGAAVDCLKQADWTPLMLACTKRDINIIKYLVNVGSNIRLKNKDGWNSFHIACREGSKEIVEFLLNCDEGLWNVCTKNGRTPLHTAALHGHLDVAKILLQRGDYASDVVDSCGSTPLMDALRSGHTDIAELLVSSNKSDVYKEDNVGRTALHLAAQVGCDKSVRWLVCCKGLNVNLKSSISGITALHLAAKEGQSTMISLLCSLGADINMTDNKGRTALHQACGGQFTTCVHILRENGAVDKPDNNNVLPSSLIQRKNTNFSGTNSASDS